MSTVSPRAALGLVAAILGSILLANCAFTPPPLPAQGGASSGRPPVESVAPMGPNAVGNTGGAARTRADARWVPVGWSDLPGWQQDRTAELWPALLRGCEKPAFEWVRLCEDAKRAPPTNDAQAREFLQQRLQPFRIEALDGSAEGLATGYFEPQVDAVRTARGNYRVPLWSPPSDLASKKPYWTRKQLDTVPAAKAAVQSKTLALVADPLDALIIQIQGSGRLRVTENDGSTKLVRLAFAAHNDQTYKSIGRWLIDQGALKPDEASWPGIRNWARQHPARINELLWTNPRVVFFKEETLDATVGPKGAQGVPLTPGRSVAVDARNIPYGTPLWIDTTEPLSTTPLRRAVMAQDTGTAIVGAVRADYFWGWGSSAEEQAGRMKQPLKMWVLWPKT